MLRHVRSPDFGSEQLRLLPEHDVIQYLVARSEDQWLERVSSRIAAREVGNLEVGFANAEGGLLVIGVHDGRIEGVSKAPTRVNEWRQAAMDFTNPPVRHTFGFVECANAEGEADRIAVLEIEPSERAHENVRGETYLRVGDENRRLSALEAQELRYDKGDSSFDGTAVDAGLGDLDAALVARYRRRLRAASTTEGVLEARGLAVEREGEIRPTVAGLLLLGQKPQIALPEASVRLLRYTGSSRETGARANVVADHRLDGPITAQVQSARRFLRRWLPHATRLESAGRFATSTLIPEVVWLEAIVNAVTHRSYSIGGDHIRVELFEDRLEVESPGRLPGLVRLENIRSTRFARNPRIARGMSELGYGRELGEGVDRMFEEMSRVGLSDPVFTQGPASVRVILLSDPLARRVLDRLPAGSEKLVEHLSRTGRVTTTQATELLRASRPTALKYLRELQLAGLIVHVGTSLKDPRGFWRLERGVGDG